MSESPLVRLRIGLLTLVGLIVVGAAGYWSSGFTLIEAVYMVALIFSTVGFEEVRQLSPGQMVFTTFLIVVGVSTFLYIAGGMIQMVAEGEINRALGHRRVTRDIERLRDHVILCGFGRMGETLARELHRNGIPFVLIENDAERIAEASAQRYLAVSDDATQEEALLGVGVMHARTLVTTLPGDADNVFITLTAHNLNPAVRIIARGELRSTEKKLIQAGADSVVLPATTAAQRMATMITRPSAVELIEVVAGRQLSEIELDELLIPADSPLVGITVRQSEPRTRHGLMIIAVRHADGRLEFNPGGDTAFQTGTSVMVMGRREDIDRFREDYGL
jgi:voltage-gated potassium channel